MKLNQHQKREHIVQRLYSIDVSGESTDLSSFTEDGQEDSYVIGTAASIMEHRAAIDELIQPCLRRKLEFLTAVDRAILRLAVWEIGFAEPPLAPKIAINEAVLLSKTYSDGPTYRLINGTLDAVVKKYKKD